MTFHPDKCSVLTITNKKNPVKHNYLLHNHTLESVSSAKYLGITLQSDLKWTQHANNIVANANKSLGFLKRNLKTSNTNIKSQAYLSLVCPKLEYACSVWNRHTAIKLRWSNDEQLGMPVTDTIILAVPQTCYKLSPGLHYNNVDSKQNLSCSTRLFTI